MGGCKLEPYFYVNYTETNIIKSLCFYLWGNARIIQSKLNFNTTRNILHAQWCINLDFNEYKLNTYCQ